MMSLKSRGFDFMSLLSANLMQALERIPLEKQKKCAYITEMSLYKF